MNTQPSAIRRYGALALWLLVAGMFFSLAAQWISLSSSDKQFSEYLQSMVSQAARSRRPAREIRSLVLNKARELSIPVQDEGINITGHGQTLQTLVDYDSEMKIPILDRVFYRMEFRHEFGAKTPR